MTKANISSRYSRFGWTAYAVLLIYRVLFVVLIQPGYLHPDEFFQSVEIGAGDVYGVDVYRSWEFRTTGGGPLRSIAGLSPFVHLPLWISKHLLPPFSSEYNGTRINVLTGEELVTRILIPLRLQTFICSLAVDIFILLTCAHLRRPNSHQGPWRLFSTTPPIALLLYSSATFGGFILSGRTLANTWEMTSVAVFGIMYIILIDYLKHGDNLLKVTIILAIQAVLSGWAIFLRCTYPIFIFPLAVMELTVVIGRLRQRVILPGSLALLTIALTVQACLHVDTVYFTRSDLLAVQPMQNVVCVPCRFFAYNSRVEHLSEHGLHPYYFHLLVNLPLMFGPLLGFWALWPPAALFSNYTLIWLSVVFPLAFLSTIPHQEARFLLPLVPFLLITVGSKLERQMRSVYRWKRHLCALILALWCMHQIILAIIYGRLHQAGVLSYLQTVPAQAPESNECPIHVFYHTYMPPRFPLGRVLTASRNLSAPGEDLCNHVLDLGGSSVAKLSETLNDLRVRATNDSNKFWIVNLIYPGSLGSLNETFSKFGTVRSINSILGHLSFEDPPCLWPLWEQLYKGSFKQLQVTLRDQLSIKVATLILG